MRFAFLWSSTLTTSPHKVFSCLEVHKVAKVNKGFLDNIFSMIMNIFSRWIRQLGMMLQYEIIYIILRELVYLFRSCTTQHISRIPGSRAEQERHIVFHVYAMQKQVIKVSSYTRHSPARFLFLRL